MHKQSGFNLFELLIAMVVIAVILLAVVKWQVYSVRGITQSYYRSVAVTQVNNMLDRLRANTAAASRQRELNRWNQFNQQRLPDGHGSYSCSKVLHACTVQVVWFDKKTRHVYADMAAT